MDDILVHGDTEHDHDEAVKAVLQRLSELNITLNGDKCEFKKSEINFFGMTISRNGIKPNVNKMQDFIDSPAPKDAKEVKSFLGLANYFGNRIPNLATISEPLRTLLHKHNQFKWGEREQSSFEQIKTDLIRTCLGHFDITNDTELIVDASPIGASAWLLQTDKNGKKRIIACASRSFSGPEKNFSQVEKEAFACVWACEHFHIYVYGHHFTLITDNKAVQSIYIETNFKKRTTLRMQRWRSRLTQYKLRIKHKPGNENIADFLSRCLKHKAYKCSSDLDTEFHINRIVTDSEDFVTESVNQKLPVIS